MKKNTEENGQKKIGNLLITDTGNYDTVLERVIIDFEDVREVLNKLLVDNGFKGLYSTMAWWDRNKNQPSGYIVLQEDCPYLIKNSMNQNNYAHLLNASITNVVMAKNEEINDILSGSFIPEGIPKIQPLVEEVNNTFVIPFDIELALNTAFGFDGTEKYLVVSGAKPKERGGTVLGVLFGVDIINKSFAERFSGLVDYDNSNKSKGFTLKNVVRQTKY